MIGLDTNVLARYYIADRTDTEAQGQRIAAQRLIDSGQPLMLCKTVLLELEWLMRGYYGFSPAQTLPVLRHLLGIPYIVIEDRDRVEQAIANYAAGLEFADALHHTSYRDCASMASFDERRFARCAKKLGLSPPVSVLK